MIAFFVLFILYKLGEYLYETIEEVNKVSNTSGEKKLCGCEAFKALFTKCFSCFRKKQEGTYAENPDSEMQKLARANTPFKSDERFSMNIYEEMTIEDLKREYQKTQIDKQSYEDDLK